jgi:hypothetical protein
LALGFALGLLLGFSLGLADVPDLALDGPDTGLDRLRTV